MMETKFHEVPDELREELRNQKASRTKSDIVTKLLEGKTLFIEIPDGGDDENKNVISRFYTAASRNQRKLVARKYTNKEGVKGYVTWFEERPSETNGEK